MELKRMANILFNMSLDMDDLRCIDNELAAKEMEYIEKELDYVKERLYDSLYNALEKIAYDNENMENKFYRSREKGDK